MDGGLRILEGDCRDVLPTLEPQSVQCCVTSPPYWGLRDYGTARWEGGEAGCDHKQSNYDRGERANRSNVMERTTPYREMCGKCGARRSDSQLGLESTPEEYITKMVAVFREVWRVLKPDATCWVNMGDTYNSHPGQRKTTDQPGPKQSTNGGSCTAPSRYVASLKPKDLCGIPWRLAFALQADGWYLRSDIIWAKPNPMPESMTDRPTKAHEYIFLLTKAERYFYDAEAIRELADRPEGAGNVRRQAIENQRNGENSNLINGLWKVGPREFRNKRSVWTVATQPYSEAHFATFPEEIPKLCILAGSKPGDTILDPFAGSGTVGQVALELGRRAILIELSPDYIALVHERTNVTPGFF